MSFELALGLWTAVTLLAVVCAAFLLAVFAPELRAGWRVRLRGGPR
jgi:hypothetical protein